jgi:4-amino-4-deoxy-L-arabinose transferase-like glycosyltransferase
MFDSPPAAWNRLLAGTFGRTGGWLLPAAFLTVIAGLVSRHRHPRTDLVRAGLLLWGTWLLVFTVAFSATSTGWPYYTAVLSPAAAAVLGAGSVLARDRAEGGPRRLATLMLIVVVTLCHILWLLPREGTGLAPWLLPLLGGMTAITVLLLAASRLQVRARQPLAVAGLSCAAATLLLVPITASASIVAHRMGPFDTPFQPRSTTESNRAGMTRVPDLARLAGLSARSPYLLAAQPAGLSSRFVFYGGHRVVPIGGLAGNSPEPTVEKLAGMVANGDFHLVIAVPSADARYAWISSHCALTRRHSRTEWYYCRPSDANQLPAR